MEAKPHILVLAAGKGTRMISELPKVLHPVLFRPMIHFVLDLAYALPHRSVSIVVGHGESQVREACSGYSDLRYFRQEQQRGTADAVRAAGALLESGQGGSLLLLSGDVALLRKETIETLLRTHHESGAAATVLTAKLEAPRGYGRLLRDSGGQVLAIREEKDCSEAERRVNEVNAGIYCFEIDALRAALSKVQDRNAQREFYLTDVIEGLARERKIVRAECLEDPREMLGVNDRRELARVDAILQERVNDALMRSGVTLIRPETIRIDPRCRISPDVVIEPSCQIIDSEIETFVTMESHCRIESSKVRSHAHVKQGTYVEKCEIGRGATVGPYARLRPGSVLGAGVKIGNFVEMKNAKMGEGSKAGHLSYIGDAEVGRHVNLGCGFITCNFDGGPVKHKTIIEDGVFIGSDSQTVAPVRIGKESYVASGTTVTADVPPESLAISRGRQVTKEGYARKYLSRRKDEK